MSTDDGLFGVVPSLSSYKPQPTFVLPSESDSESLSDPAAPGYVRGPGTSPGTTGPEQATAPDYWKQEATATVLRLARHYGSVTSDDLRRMYPDQPSATGAAIGALFRGLVRSGRLRLVRHVPSTRPEARGRYIGVYEVPR